MKIRFLSLEAFAVINFFVILSLIYAPAPWLGGMGYSNRSVMLSTATGVVLAFLAFSTALAGWLSFRAYLVASAVIGLGSLAYAIAFVPSQPGAHGAFLAYGICLLLTAAAVRMPEKRRVENVPSPIQEPLWIERTERRRPEKKAA